MIWIPATIMFFAYTMIWFKLRKASKAFPYLSQQSRIARSRQKVIHMLFLLIIIELICWGPWQFFTLCEYITHKYYASNPPEVNRLFHIKTSQSVHHITLFQWWSEDSTLVKVLLDIKFYFIFFNSALNPFIYGYNNQTMQKAFRITFTCLFKDKVKISGLLQYSFLKLLYYQLRKYMHLRS